MTVSETLRLASEALQQVSVALAATAQTMEDAPGPAPAPEPEPGEWRNDRAPRRREGDSLGKVWVWDSGCPRLTDVDLVSFWYESCPARNYWAPGNRPKPTSSPLVSMTDGHGAKLGPKPEKTRGFFPFTPKEFAAVCPEPQPEAPPRPDESRTGGWIVDRVPDASDSSDEARGLVRIPQRPGTPQRPPGDPLLTCHWSAVQLGQPWAPIGYRVDPWDPTCLDRNGWIRSRLPTVEDTGHTGHVLIPVGHGGTTSTIDYHLIVPGQPWAPWGSSPGRFEK